LLFSLVQRRFSERRPGEVPTLSRAARKGAWNGKNYIETVWGLGYVLHDPVEIEAKIPA
jgi:hypothetical protein